MINKISTWIEFYNWIYDIFNAGNKTEVTSVKLVLFKFLMSFETLTKLDQLTEILMFGKVLSQKIVANCGLVTKWSTKMLGRVCINDRQL